MSSPVLAPSQAVEVTLSLFGGTDTEISPADIPEGLSPDNQDMIFLPGETANRPGLSKLFATPFPNNASVLYQKTYVQPNNQPVTLILTSDGKLWVEQVAISPGAYAQIGQVPAGLYAQSVTAFGREYLAFSDLLHGQGVPLQFDGTNLDRVTQDGPGANPVSLTDETTAYTIAASATGLNNLGTSSVQSGSQAGLIVTLVVKNLVSTSKISASFRAGDSFQIAGVGAGYDGTFPVTGLIQIDSSHFSITYLSGTAGLASVGAGGTVGTGYYTVQFSPSASFALNSNITIAGAGVGGYNGSWPVRSIVLSTVITIYISGFPVLANSGGGTMTIAGNISIGQHQMVVIFLTRQGSLTAPSPAISWTAAGGKRVILSNVPIGPANVVARLFGFTGAGGDNFFILPTQATLPQPSGQPVIIPALTLPDNTSTTVTLDFSDNALFAGIPIDQIGNDLFDQRVLGPVLGFFGYASRLACWGDYVKVENFLNMGFAGGYLAGAPFAPLGWTADTAGGQLASGGSWPLGNNWQITADGSANQIGRISQTAYQDSFGNAILSPNTSYIFRFWVSASSPIGGGNVVAELFSPTAGLLASATIAVNTLTTLGGFAQAAFNAPTPATIPSDTLFRISEVGMPLGTRIFLSEFEFVFAQNPFNNTLSRWSYALNPEGFAQTTGNLGASDDDSALQNFSLQKNTGLLHTLEATHEFVDNNFEPGDGDNSWPVNSLTHSVGALSLRACDPGKFGTGDSAEDWDIIASKNGAYIHLGASFYKVAQEMSRTVGTSPFAVTWDDINWAAQQTIWVKNVINKRYALIGAPVNGATTPNVIFVLDYREMDTAAQIAAALPIHITLTGKMKSSDMTRKWTRWNIAANSAEVLIRPGNGKELYLGGGVSPSTGLAYGNIYSLDPAKLTDDDYGQIRPYYITYAFIDHDQEQQLQLGSGRHLYRHISAFITGVGLVYITPFVNSLTNPLPPTTPRQLSVDTAYSNTVGTDLEWSTGVRGQRVFFRIDVSPLPGTTDVQLKLQKLIVLMQKDPVALFRGSRI